MTAVELNAQVAPSCESLARRDAEFTSFVVSHRPALQRLAYRLSSDWHAAEDLVQTALLKLYQAWPRLSGTTAMEAYTRRILVHTHIDERRRSRRRPETPTSEPLEQAAPLDPTGEPPQVLQGLRTLPDRQRAVVVLRYLLDLSIADTAETLACSTGNVKSQAARGLARLRLNLELDDQSLAPDRMDTVGARRRAGPTAAYRAPRH